MTNPEEPKGWPPELRFLKALVTALTLTMMLGVIAVVALLVTRMPKGVSVPAQITLPPGVTAEAVTLGQGWAAVVSGNRLFIFDGATGRLKQEVAILP